MKLSKKKVFALAIAVCLIATLSMGSLAWFTDEDSVTNNFLVGDTDTPADEVFGIEVWEDRDADNDGIYEDEKEDGLDYEAILPGEVLSKEPYLENTGIHPQFVRAIVTVTDAAVLREAMEGAWGNADKFLAGTPDTWTLEDILYINDDTLVYVYYYEEILAAGETTDKIFTDVVIPTGLTKEQAAQINDFQITILGQAIQSEHLADPDVPGTMVATAQRAFELYWDAEGTVAGYTADQILANGKINEDSATTAVYYTAEIGDPQEISITKVTASVTDAFVYIPAEVFEASANANCTVIIDGCDITVAEGGYIVNFGIQGGMLVVITPDTVINGVAASEWAKADLMVYFNNVDSTMVWITSID